MTFEEWWTEYWRSNGLPNIMNLAFKEIAQKAWDTAIKQIEKSRQENLDSKFSLTFTEFYD